MVEIKFNKSFPVKQVNDNSDLLVTGADLYLDINGKKYVYVSFKNQKKNPFFGFVLNIKQFDEACTLIKENKFYEPSIYGAREGTYIIEDPLQIDKEIEALEIEVLSVDYLQSSSKSSAYQDKDKNENEKDELPKVLKQSVVEYKDETIIGHALTGVFGALLLILCLYLVVYMIYLNGYDIDWNGILFPLWVGK